MKKLIILIFLISIGCKEKKKDLRSASSEIIPVINEDYELIKIYDSKALLIVFPGGGTTSKETKENFKIIEKAKNNNISVLLMNFNRHLWIDDKDSQQLKVDLEKIIEENNLNTDNAFIGGMSIGGTVAISISDFLHESNSSLRPKGVFVVDSPIDLYALYQSSKKDVSRKDFTEERLAEPKFIIEYFESEFGKDDSLLQSIQKVSPVTLQTRNPKNISHLKNKKIRFYTEPDTLWWKENRQTDFKSTNAHILQKTHALLNDKGWKNVQLIQTKNKGYRINGERHPHSWSIIDVDNLIDWILE